MARQRAHLPQPLAARLRTFPDVALCGSDLFIASSNLLTVDDTVGVVWCSLWLSEASMMHARLSGIGTVALRSLL